MKASPVEADSKGNYFRNTLREGERKCGRESKREGSGGRANLNLRVAGRMEYTAT